MVNSGAKMADKRIITNTTRPTIAKRLLIILRNARLPPTGSLDYQKAVMDNNNQGWKDELVLVIVVLPIVVLSWSVFSGDPQAKEKLDLFFEYFNNFPEFYKWLVLGIFGSIYGLKPGMDLFKKK